MMMMMMMMIYSYFWLHSYNVVEFDDKYYLIISILIL